MTETHPLEPRAFEQLRAEYEEDWLEEVFIEPDEMAGMISGRSVLVFGADGAGKTALAIMLARQAQRAEDGRPQLVVHWYPTVSEKRPSDLRVQEDFRDQVLDACALALMRYLGQNPARFPASKWHQETVVWLIYQYLLGDKELMLSRMERECTPDGLALLSNILGRQAREVFSPSQPLPEILKELIYTLRELGLSGVWVIVDELTASLESNPEALLATFQSLFSTLALFEVVGFSIKAIVPSQIKDSLLFSSGSIRRRFATHDLKWSDELLAGMVERRLALALGRADIRLKDLSKVRPDELLDWLKKYGGSSPRGWLKLTRKLADAYLAQGQQALNEAEWIKVSRQLLPPLRVDAQTGQVFLGDGLVTDLQPAAYKMLEYLYRHPKRRCTREELYYRMYLGKDHEPRPFEDGWTPRKSWNRIIDTTIHRLRQALEPDPKHPVYVITDRGKRVVRLENTW